MIAQTRVNRYFFQISNNLHNEIIALQDFVQPTATALWHFRSVISNEIGSNPALTAPDLAKKYNTAPKTRGTTNLIVPFESISWDVQRERLAEIALVNIIALYEIWCDEICSSMGSADQAVKFQFPTNISMTRGVRSGIEALTQNISPGLVTGIYPSLKKASKYSLSNIDNLLKCYRYFKELRNCFMHRGRKCDGKLYGAQSEFIPVATKAGLGMSFIPEHKVYAQGDSIELSFHGVLGFTDVILRIVTTIDIELSKSIQAEPLIMARIASVKKQPTGDKTVRSILNTFGIQGITMTAELKDLMQQHNVLK